MRGLPTNAVGHPGRSALPKAPGVQGGLCTPWGGLAYAVLDSNPAHPRRSYEAPTSVSLPVNGR